ncbi:uncharacterized protein LOC131250150 [Magnolia sinica]|uniref:uncharacterized protein LOC131250150 n=1 Tax=Magnolia sinica TaxID=86752 RepID=UPI00265ABD64|nr:uncharacterized protein LOC131250150 [Magnolia sinica]
MVSSDGIGLMAVVAISGSVALVALEAHRRLLAEFLKKVELELGAGRNNQHKKKVRFADDVIEPSSNNKEYRKQHMKISTMMNGGDDRIQVTVGITGRDSIKEIASSIPPNRLALYKGIIEQRMINGHIPLYC